MDEWLQVATVFDWIAPSAGVLEMLMGLEPIHVPNECAHEAAGVLGQEPLGYDPWTDCWFWLVEDADNARAQLEAVGIPCM